MNTELQQETTIHDVELRDTCACCGGLVAARFTPGSARGVCLACHLVTGMTLVRAGEGVRIVQAPGGVA
jgi:hypothetical protein